MQLNSTVDPIYFPEADQQSVLLMGLQPLQLQNWIQLDSDFEQFHQHKLQQHELHAKEVCDEIDGASDCIAEFNALLLRNLLEHHSQTYQMRDNQLLNTEADLVFNLPAASLWDSSIWIQEDICLLQPREDELILAAASLCSPSNWELQDKLGHNIDVIHQPVPQYATTLSERVNKLLAALKPEKPVQRFNWSVQRGNELYWQDKHAEQSTSPSLYWRVERQTLLRLPETGAIVFGIRIYLHDFEIMARDAAFLPTLSQIVERQSPETRNYKDLDLELFERLQRE